MTEYLRLAAATAVVLAPGFLIARAFGQRSTSATLAWAFAAIFAAWTVVFVVHGTISLALVVLGAIGVIALLRGHRRPQPFTLVAGHGTVLAVGLLLGIALWHVAGPVTGDGLFHLARVRKLVDLGDLHLRTVNEFHDGGLHPGYAFPLWHGFLALIAKVAGLDPSLVVGHEAAVLAPIACAVAWEAGVAVFGASAAGVAVLAGSLAVFCFAAGNGGAYTSLALPATGSRQLLVPAAYALFFRFAASGKRGELAALVAVFGALALVHPTYALFALLPLSAYAVVRLPEWRRSLAALAAALIPTGLAVVWLKPIVDETIAHNPGPAEQARALRHYAGELSVTSIHHYRLAAEVMGRTGAVAVAALVLVPLAGIAARSRWGAFVLGGTVAVLGVMLVPQAFVHFADAVSLSQARRAAGFAPLPFVFAGGLALLCRFRVAIPVALVAGIALEQRWPGDFSYGLREGGPAIVTWVAFLGGVLALAAGLLFTRVPPRERFGRGAIAAVLFVAPVAWHGFTHWTPRVTTDPNALSADLIAQVQALPDRAVVIAAPATSYEILALAPVYVVAAPKEHVADTRANQPQERIDAVALWLRSHDPTIAQRYGATWAVEGGRLYRLTS
ncbi:MAG: hypothetical protein WCH31_06460 [Actinomycetes bacterium]